MSRECVDTSEYRETVEVHLIRGITGRTLESPLVEIPVHSLFVTGRILAYLIESLPQGVSMLVGNDLDV